MKIKASKRGSNDVLWEHNARTKDIEIAIDRAVRAKHGQKCFFEFSDISSQTRKIGQVFKRGLDSSMAETGILVLDVSNKE